MTIMTQIQGVQWQISKFEQTYFLTQRLRGVEGVVESAAAADFLYFAVVAHHVVFRVVFRCLKHAVNIIMVTVFVDYVMDHRSTSFNHG